MKEDRPKRSRRARSLSAEDRKLWAKIVESVHPLPGRDALPPPDAEEPPPVSPARASDIPAPAAPQPRRKSPPPLATLEPKLARTLRRGGEVDARLDLHGFRQDEAHARLIGFLQKQQARGARVVLVITGKGRREPEGGALFEERGVLKRLVPVWLAEPVLRDVVVGFSEASQAHGGAGALYVRLRRSR